MENAISATVSMTSSDCSRRRPMNPSMNQYPDGRPAAVPARQKRVSRSCRPSAPMQAWSGRGSSGDAAEPALPVRQRRPLERKAHSASGGGSLTSGHDYVAQVQHVIGALDDLQFVFDTERKSTRLNSSH